MASKKVSIAAVAGGVVVLVLFVALFVYVGSSEESNVVARFESAQDDEGSGRTYVWQAAFDLIERSDFLPLLFGHGFNKVEKDSMLGLSAHNDFLEVTYDYGIVGLALYVSAFSAVGLIVFRLIRKKSPYAPAMAMFFTIYFLLSMISHIIIYSWACVIMLTISYVSAKEKLDARNQ